MNLTNALQQASKLLKHYQPFWDFNAFTQNPSHLKPLLTQLAHLTEAELWAIDNHPQQQAQFFAHVFAPLFEWLNHNEPVLAAKPQQALPFWLSTDIPGRKWQQIQQFASQLPTTGSALEWCAGKGHLGRLRSWQHKSPVISLEWQEALCTQGQNSAQQLKLPQTFICANAFKLPLPQSCNIPVWAALHACGDLHTQFL